MSNVTALPGVQPQSFVNQEAIEMLEKVVERLKSGEVVGIAYATINPSGLGTNGWLAPSGMGNHLFSSLARMQHLMLASAGDET